MSSDPPLPLDVIRTIVAFLTPFDGITVISAQKSWYNDSKGILTLTGHRLAKRKRLHSDKLIRLCREVSNDGRALNLLRSEFRRRNMDLHTIGVIHPGNVWNDCDVRVIEGKIYVLLAPRPHVKYDLRLIILRVDEQEFLHQYCRNHTLNVALICGTSSASLRIHTSRINLRIHRAKKVEEGLEDFLHFHSGVKSFTAIRTK